MSDPVIKEAEKWCNKARTLLNMASLPGNDRWVMGNRTNDVAGALKKLQPLALSPAYLKKYNDYVNEFSALGVRAKAAKENKKEAEAKTLSGELAGLAARIQNSKTEITEAKAKVATARVAARKVLAEFKRVFSDFTTAYDQLEQELDDADTANDNGHFVEALKILTDFEDTVQAKKDTVVAALINLRATTPIAGLKGHAAFATSGQKVANLRLCQPLLDDVDAMRQSAVDLHGRESYAAAVKGAYLVYWECKRLTPIVQECDDYTVPRAKLEARAGLLPTDHKALKKAISDKAVGDYTATLAAAKVEADNLIFSAARPLLDTAGGFLTVAEQVVKDANEFDAEYKLAKKAVDKLPGDNALIKTEVEKLKKQLGLAEEKATAREYGAARALLQEISTLRTSLAKAAKSADGTASKAKLAGESDDHAEAIKALRALWQDLGKRSPGAVPKLIAEDLKKIDEKLKAVETEVSEKKKKETEAPKEDAPVEENVNV